MVVDSYQEGRSCRVKKGNNPMQKVHDKLLGPNVIDIVKF